jgi:NitT/TauT family transport system substrate-binding protein
MALKIMPHGRLQEWVAEEKGFFAAEGLEYSFVLSSDYGIGSVRRDDAGEIRTGAFETFGAGRDGADVSCACHWATNAAARERAGQLVTTAYSVAPCAIVVPPESPVRRPEDLAGVPIGVGRDPAVDRGAPALHRGVRAGRLRRGRPGLTRPRLAT